MDLIKLRTIIDKQNDNLEYEALRQAERLIEAIANHQELITRTEAEILKLRTQLKELQVKQIDPNFILGGE